MTSVICLVASVVARRSGMMKSGESALASTSSIIGKARVSLISKVLSSIADEDSITFAKSCP